MNNIKNALDSFVYNVSKEMHSMKNFSNVFNKNLNIQIINKIFAPTLRTTAVECSDRENFKYELTSTFSTTCLPNEHTLVEHETVIFSLDSY